MCFGTNTAAQISHKVTGDLACVGVTQRRKRRLIPRLAILRSTLCSRAFPGPSAAHAQEGYLEHIATQLRWSTQLQFGNVVKHTKAAKVIIGMSCSGSRFRIIVENDDAGFDADAVSKVVGRGVGFGLIGTRDRMADVGESVEIVSRPGEGRRAVVMIPRARVAREEE